MILINQKTYSMYKNTISLIIPTSAAEKSLMYSNVLPTLTRCYHDGTNSDAVADSVVLLDPWATLCSASSEGRNGSPLMESPSIIPHEDVTGASEAAVLPFCPVDHCPGR